MNRETRLRGCAEEPPICLLLCVSGIYGLLIVQLIHVILSNWNNALALQTFTNKDALIVNVRYFKQHQS